MHLQVIHRHGLWVCKVGTLLVTPTHSYKSINDLYIWLHYKTSKRYFIHKPEKHRVSTYCIPPDKYCITAGA